jgi:hypothetical protein
MARKSKRKTKKHIKKEVPKVQPPKTPPTAPTSSKLQRPIWTIVGLLLTLIGLVTLIELFPRLSATGKSPTDPDNPLSSSKFTVNNDGYLKLTDVMSACFIWRVDQGGKSMPVERITNTLAIVVRPPENVLMPTEGFTVPCTANPVVSAPPPYIQPAINLADLAIVVYYRAWPFTFYRGHRLFRFVANIGRHGEISWDKQPADALGAAYDKFLNDRGGSFPPSFK